ncbi:unnamed protein product [Phytophthora fragariaefolia]|uniref:Unnamed protein product n=1 Tax=Phytophthora fragariaefolia TaxID=1490495 RepID=A0A9W6YLI4_9STRA|nr:unnamed protein product [Phytophthora fragariaefolia]
MMGQGGWRVSPLPPACGTTPDGVRPLWIGIRTLRIGALLNVSAVPSVAMKGYYAMNDYNAVKSAVNETATLNTTGTSYLGRRVALENACDEYVSWCGASLGPCCEVNELSDVSGDIANYTLSGPHANAAGFACQHHLDELSTRSVYENFGRGKQTRKQEDREVRRDPPTLPDSPVLDGDRVESAESETNTKGGLAQAKDSCRMMGPIDHKGKLLQSASNLNLSTLNDDAVLAHTERVVAVTENASDVVGHAKLEHMLIRLLTEERSAKSPVLLMRDCSHPRN